jgi:hypothetical protein
LIRIVYKYFIILGFEIFLELIINYLERNKILNKKTSKYILTILISHKYNTLGYLPLKVCFLYYNTYITFYNIYVGVRLLGVLLNKEI